MGAQWLYRLAGAGLVGLAGWGVGTLIGTAAGNSAFYPWTLVGVAVGVALGLLAAPYILRPPIRRLARSFEDISFTTLVSAAIGLTMGLVIATLLSVPLSGVGGWPGVAIPTALSVLLGALGAALMVGRRRDLFQLMTGGSRRGPSPNRSSDGARVLMDTSAIIDGRIADISKTGFVRGTLVIPRFILDELRHIADSSDAMRRNRGRRGLEMLNRLRKEADVPIQILDADVQNGADVDSQLVKLARSLQAQILTTDFNLNRVAELQGVRVLNVNELANALKPAVLPGEEMTVRVIQEGKEMGQGVAFLDDGTMVVIEGGRRYINSQLDVSITRMLQTAAGRIIFAQPRED